MWTAPSALAPFVPVIEHLTRRDWGDNAPPNHTGLSNVALFATPATVRSGAFPRELRFRARDVTVVPQACTGLVEAIEAGDLDRAGAIAREHVAALLGTVDAVKGQRDRIVEELTALGLRVVPSDANFVFFEVPGGDQQALWRRMLDHGVLIRDVGIPGMLRVTAGTEPETTAFLNALKESL